MRARFLLALSPLLLIGSEVAATDSSGAGSAFERLILPATLGGPTLTDDSITTRLYVDGTGQLAMFFTGSGGRYTAHFIDAQGLVDPSPAPLSPAALASNSDPAPWAAYNRANQPLTDTGLPDHEFRMISAQGGFLVEAQYGKLFFLSYVATNGDQLKLKLGTQIDMGLLAKLARDAGISGAIQAVPMLTPPAGSQANASAPRGPAWLRFTTVPDKLSSILSGNAAGLFSGVSARDDAWEVSPLAPPKSISDSAAIEAIRLNVAGSTAMSAEDYSGDTNMADNAVDESTMATNAM